MVSGPLTDRLGLVAAGSWRRLSHVAAPNASDRRRDRVASGFAHLVFAATPAGRIPRARLGAAGHDGRGHGYRRARSVHLGAARPCASCAWRVFGGYTERGRSAPVASSLVVDSLTSDPVSDLIDAGAGTARRWALGARVAPGRSALPVQHRRRSRRRSSARRANGNRADPRAGRRRAGAPVDAAGRRRRRQSTSHDVGGVWKRARDLRAPDPRRGPAARSRDRRGGRIGAAASSGRPGCRAPCCGGRSSAQPVSRWSRATGAPRISCP